MRKAGDDGSAGAEGGFDLEMATGQSDPFAHAPQAELSLGGRAGREIRGVKAASIIFYDNLYIGLAAIEEDRASNIDLKYTD